MDDYTPIVVAVIGLLTTILAYFLQSPRGQSVVKVVATVFPEATDEDIVKAVAVFADRDGRTAILQAIRDYPTTYTHTPRRD